MLENVQAVALLGAGTIGGSWAIVFTRAGISTRVHDPDPRQLDELPERFDADVRVLVEAGLVEEAQAKTMRELLQPERDLEQALAGAEYVQESAPEDLALKQSLFQRLDELTPPEVVLASSVSALPMTRIAAHVENPQRCVVAHPTNPPHIVPLVEIVAGEMTDPAVTRASYQFMERIGQKPIMCRSEIFGFVLNRIQMALLREALYLHRAGIASAADIDRCVHEGLGLRWAFLGPFGVEHTNAASIEEDLRKFGPGLKQLFADVCHPYDGPTEEDIEAAAREVEQMFQGRSQPDLVAHRNRMVLQVRALKQSTDVYV